VFELSQGHETVLYSFSGNPDGAYPEKLTLDHSGNLYGTTVGGGAFDHGTVFELSPNVDGTWTEQVLYSFTGKEDGAWPYSGVIVDAKGSLYGTTWGGGLSAAVCACGVVFKLKQNPDGTWSEHVLHSFGSTAADGQRPYGGLVRDKQGNLYGVTLGGGGASGWGTVFELDSAGNEKVLHVFTGAPTGGAEPAAGLIMDASGNLYGTTSGGGHGGKKCGSGCGTVFKITP
jgi:uncharacterized repeat protein (TIGR03803 family)